MRASAGVGSQLRQHLYILKTRVTETLIETTVRAPSGAGQPVRERGDLHLQLSAHGNVDERLHIDRPHDDSDTPTRPRDAHHLTEHPLSVQEFHDGRRHRYVEAIVPEWQDFRVAFAKLDILRQTFLRGQGRGLSQQGSMNVDRRDPMRSAGMPCQPAVEDAGATPHIENRLTRTQVYFGDEIPYHPQVARAPTACFKAGDRPQDGTAQREGAVLRAEPGE